MVSEPNAGAMIVWDCESSPPKNGGKVVLWRSCAIDDENNEVSVSRLVEEQASHFKAVYLSWIHDLGESVHNGERIVDALRVRPNLSYWWMTSIAQTFNESGSSNINNAIKLLAFEQHLKKQKPSSVRIVSDNSELKSVLADFLVRMGIPWTQETPALNSARANAKSRVDRLPDLLQTLLYVIWFIYKRFPLFFSRRPSKPSYHTLSFFDVFTHMRPSGINKGVFESNYWTSLVDSLTAKQVGSNWFHVFFMNGGAMGAERANGLCSSFTESSKRQQVHELIDQRIGFGGIWVALRDYVSVRRIARKLMKSGSLQKNFRPQGSVLDFWPLFRSEWNDTFFGKGSITTFIQLAMIERLVRDLPTQKIGVFIQENQPWELALISAWRRFGHGQLIGVPHTTVRYWDLRYFYDPRAYTDQSTAALPRPDIVAVNGPIAEATYVAGGYPKQEIRIVEALRYLDLAAASSRVQPSSVSDSNKKTLLICGDFLASTNESLIQWLREALRILPIDLKCVFKPHPAFPFTPPEDLASKMEVSQAPLQELIAASDIVFTSNITSAAVNAYCFGVPVIQALNGNSFNVSPLRGLNGVTYVSSGQQLAATLLAGLELKTKNDTQYFHLESDLPRWHRLLDLDLPTVDRRPTETSPN